MKKLFSIMTQRRVLIFIGLCLLAMLVWFVGPRWPIFESAEGVFSWPLASVKARLIAIALIFGLWLVVIGAKALYSTIAAARLKNAVAESAQSQAQLQVGQIEDAFADAVEALEKQKGGKGKRALAELPWYMVLGPSGVGKTELLRSSGLDFPFESEARKKYVDGAGGTLNCKWWLGRDAILLDTAGRYVQQDQNGDADRAEWERFLALLRTHRRRQPLSGLVAVISADDVLETYAGNREAMRAEADRLRARVQELNAAFNQELPVYLIVAKTDLVAGFSEYFRDLNSADLRAQVWGFDLRRDGTPLPEQLKSGFSRLLARLRVRTLRRLRAESGHHYCVPVQSFAWQLENLTVPLGDFVELAFGEDTMGHSLRLRGVYLTSATQSGRPIDQLTSELSQVFGIAEAPQSQVGGEGLSYFVRELFTHKIFPEQTLAGESGRFRLWSRWALTGAAAVSGLAIAISALIWFSSFRESQMALAATAASITEAGRALPSEDRRGEPEAILDYLGQLRAIRDSGAAGSADIDVTRRLGLSAIPRISDVVHDLYADGLRDYFVPYLAALQYDELLRRQEVDAQTPEQPWRNTYEDFRLLEFILAFQDQEKLNSEPLKSRILQWYTTYFEAALGDDSALLEEHMRHLRHYTDAPLPSVDFSADAVIMTRERFLDRDKTRLASELLRGEMEFQLARDLNLMNSPNENIFLAVFSEPDNPQALIIPGMFTRKGFEELIDNKAIDKFVDRYRQRVWVLGNDYGLPSRRNLIKELRRLYVRDYIAVWRRALSEPRVRRTSGSAQQRAIINTLSGPRSPIREFLKTVFEQTRLEVSSSSPAPPGAGAAGRLIKKSQVGRLAARAGGGAAQTLTPRQEVTEAFALINALSDGGAQLTAIDGLLSEVAGLQRALGPAGDADITEQFKVRCGQQPEPVKTWLCSLALGSAEVADTEKRQAEAQLRDEERLEAERQIAGQYLSEIWPVCVNAIHGGYPANRSSPEDISADEFEAFFGPGGTLESFTNGPMAPHLDRASRPWRWRSDETKDALTLSSGLPRAMQRAARIQRTFFPRPLSLGLKAGEVHHSIVSLRFVIDGEPFLYQQGPTRATTIQWPGASPGASLEIKLDDGRDIRRRWNGPWALLRALDDAAVAKGPTRGTLVATFELDGISAPIVINANRAIHPLLDNPLEDFRCPSIR